MSVISKKFDLRGRHAIQQGATYERQITITNIDGTPYSASWTDASGGAATGCRCQIRADNDAETLLVTPTMTFVNRATGVIKLALTPAQTGALDMADFLANYDIEFYSASDAIVENMMHGVVELKKQITR